MNRTTFYIFWILQLLLANVIFLGLGIAYAIIGIKNTEPSIIFLAAFFIFYFFRIQNSKKDDANNIRNLIRDIKDFETGYWSIGIEFNRRYSLKRRKEISKREINKNAMKKILTEP